MFKQELANSLIEMLDRADFQCLSEQTGEKVYVRSVDETKYVYVYTSVVGNQVRDVNEDAIRVAGIYINSKGEQRGVVKVSRVYRVGNIPDIVERTLHKMREVYKRLKNCEVCKRCGAPLFQSKEGNWVCAEICWKISK